VLDRDGFADVLRSVGVPESQIAELVEVFDDLDPGSLAKADASGGRAAALLWALRPKLATLPPEQGRDAIARALAVADGGGYS
jgi:hypothetical protein